MKNAIASAGPELSADVEENAPNAGRTMMALRELGYSSYASVMDLIDNCIDGEATRVGVTVEKSGEDIVVTITDDGRGMSREQLSEALRLGSNSKHEPTDLGKFGMGLVTAAIGLSKRVEVVTRQEGRPAFFGWFSLSEIESTDKWVKHIAEADEERAARVWGSDGESGTSIRVSETDRISNRNTTHFADSLRKEIGRTYRKFLKTKRLEIEVNGRLAEPLDPLMLEDKRTDVRLEETPIRIGGRVVATVKVVELADYGPSLDESLKISPANSGFYLLRNNREIEKAQFSKLFGGRARHATLARFRAEISFDGSADDIMHTDVKKGSVTPVQAFGDALNHLVSGLIAASGRAGNREADVKRGEIDHSIVESAVPRKAALIPKPSTLIEKRASPNRAKNPRVVAANEPGGTVRQPKNTQFKTPNGLAVKFLEGNFGSAYFYSVEQKGRTLEVTYNRDHAFWTEYSNHGDSPTVVALVDYLIFALANAEQMVGSDAMEPVKANIHAALVGVLS